MSHYRGRNDSHNANAFTAICFFRLYDGTEKKGIKYRNVYKDGAGGVRFRSMLKTKFIYQSGYINWYGFDKKFVVREWL